MVYSIQQLTMACYSPNNQYLLPNPALFSQSSGTFTKYFVYGCIYGGAVGTLYCMFHWLFVFIWWIDLILNFFLFLFCFVFYFECEGNPMLRTIKLTLGWGTVFAFAFTRELYNQPGYLKRTDVFQPDLDRDSLVYIIICDLFFSFFVFVCCWFIYSRFNKHGKHNPILIYLYISSNMA